MVQRTGKSTDLPESDAEIKGGLVSLKILATSRQSALSLYQKQLKPTSVVKSDART